MAAVAQMKRIEMPAPLTLNEANIDGTAHDAENAGITFVDWGRMVGIASTSDLGNSYVEISMTDAASLHNWLEQLLDGE